MAHTITDGPRPNIMLFNMYGEIVTADLRVDDELHLNEGHTIYFLLDARRAALGLPEDFLSNAKSSAISHKNTGFAAVLVSSTMFASIARMITKALRLQNKVALFNDYDAALNHLIKLSDEHVSESVS